MTEDEDDEIEWHSMNKTEGMKSDIRRLQEAKRLMHDNSWDTQLKLSLLFVQLYLILHAGYVPRSLTDK